MRTVMRCFLGTQGGHLIGSVAVVVALSACEVSGWPQDSRQELPVHIEWLIDRTPSWPRSALEASLAEARRVCDALRPGDWLTVRFIAARSYSTSEVVTQVRLTAPSRVSGLASPAALRQRSVDSAAAAAVRDEACAKIPAAADVRMSRQTDISGAMAAASGAFKSSTATHRQLLVASSDLEQTQQPGAVTIGLHGVIALLFAVESAQGRLVDLEQSIVAWREDLVRWGATDVQVIPPGGIVDLAHYRRLPEDR